MTGTVSVVVRRSTRVVMALDVEDLDVSYRARLSVDHMARLARAQTDVLPPPLEEAYRALVREAQRRHADQPARTYQMLPLEEAHKLVGPTALDELQRLHLCTQYPDRDDPLVQIAPPSVGLSTLMMAGAAGWAAWLEAALTAVREVGVFSPQTLAQVGSASPADSGGAVCATCGRTGTADGSAGDGAAAADDVRMITDWNEVVALTGPYGLMQRAQVQFCEFSTAVTESPFSASMARVTTPFMQAVGVPYRVLYPRSMLELDAFHVGTAACIRSGEQARVVDDDAIPGKMMIVDGGSSVPDRTALVACTATGTRRAALIQNPQMVDMHQRLFEAEWEHGVPLAIGPDGRLVEQTGSASTLEPRDQKLLELTPGRTAEAVARELKKSGYPGGTRTVYRQWEALRARLNARDNNELMLRAVDAGLISVDTILKGRSGHAR